MYQYVCLILGVLCIISGFHSCPELELEKELEKTWVEKYSVTLYCSWPSNKTSINVSLTSCEAFFFFQNGGSAVNLIGWSKLTYLVALCQ